MDQNQILLSAVIAMAIYLIFNNQCQELDRYGFKVLNEGFRSVQRFVTRAKAKFTDQPDPKWNLRRIA
jgi:hypothetical protein